MRKIIRYSARTVSAHIMVVVLLFALLSVNAAADNLKGRILCSGKGVAGVKVSDGKIFTLTDKDGRYSFTSDKENGYVFYVLPSGYEPAVSGGYRPLFWARLTSSDTTVTENHNFVLHKKDNSRFRLAVGTDSHLYNNPSVEDITQYRLYYLNPLKKEAAQAKADGVPMYSVILGDLTWDVNWYKQSYSLNEFVSTNTSEKYPLILWPVMGNHDNDPSATSNNADSIDFIASAPWRRIMGPSYYSFNLGGVHFLVLDDIVYRNTPYNAASVVDKVAGKRDYYDRITSEQLAWIEKDLSYISDKSTPVIVCCHIPTMRLGSEAKNFEAYESLDNNSSGKLHDLLAPFSQVHILSGHVHDNYVAHCPVHAGITEHNQAGICSAWWNAGHFTHLKAGIYRQIARDGSPGGYAIWDANGKKLRWKYVPTDSISSGQMRIYDMNSVKDFYASNDTMVKFLKTFPKVTNYSNIADNVIMVNVFAYDTGWKVEIYEDGRKLDSYRYYGEDPLYNLCCPLQKFINSGLKTSGSGTMAAKISHLFMAKASSATKPVTVKVTDLFGNIYTSSIERPMPFDMLTGKNECDAEVTTIKVPKSPMEEMKVKVAGKNIEITVAKACRVSLTAADGSSRRIRLRAGVNVLTPGNGIYIISSGKSSCKVAL